MIFQKNHQSIHEDQYLSHKQRLGFLDWASVVEWRYWRQEPNRWCRGRGGAAGGGSSGEHELSPQPKPRAMQPRPCGHLPLTLPHPLGPCAGVPWSRPGQAPTLALRPWLPLLPASPGLASASLVLTTDLPTPTFSPGSFCSFMHYFSILLIVLGPPPSHLVVFSAASFLSLFVYLCLSSFEFSSSVTYNQKHAKELAVEEMICPFEVDTLFVYVRHNFRDGWVTLGTLFLEVYTKLHNLPWSSQLSCEERGARVNLPTFQMRKLMLRANSHSGQEPAPSPMFPFVAFVILRTAEPTSHTMGIFPGDLGVHGASRAGQ